MSKLSVNPLVLGVGAFVVAAAGTSVLAGDLDQAVTASFVDDSILTIAGAHGDGEEGECGEKDGEEEGECGEGQCGEGDHDDSDEEAEEEEEA